MSDLLEIVRSSLITTQTQLNAVGNNIANVHSDGYHRQVGLQTPVYDQYVTPLYVGGENGGGTYLEKMERLYNKFAEREQRIAQTNLSQVSMVVEHLKDLDEMFSIVGKSVENSLNAFFESVNQVVDMPSDVSVRDNMMVNGELVQRSMKQFYDELTQKYFTVNGKITDSVEKVNNITAKIADANANIAGRPNSNYGLQDERDKLLNELSEYMSITVLDSKSNDEVKVLMGGAFPIILNNDPVELLTIEGDPYPSNQRLAMRDGLRTVDIDGSTMGGEIQALFEYRDAVLVPAIERLELLGIGIAQSFNDVQDEGFDLHGNLSERMFNDINGADMMYARSAPYRSNEGSAAVSQVLIEDYTMLTGDRYTLQVEEPPVFEADGITILAGNEGQLRLLDSQNGSVLKTFEFPMIEPPATSIELDDLKYYQLFGPEKEDAYDGFNLTLRSPHLLQKGDRFEIRPMAGGANHIKWALERGEQIAAAKNETIVIDTVFPSSDLDAELTGLDRQNPNFENYMANGNTMVFTYDTSKTEPCFTVEIFDVNDDLVPRSSLEPNQPDAVLTDDTPPLLEYYGLTLEITGTLTDGDEISVNVDFGPGDNTNAYRMAEIETDTMMDQKQMTLFETYQDVNDKIGTSYAIKKLHSETMEAAFEFAKNRVQQESGVNLDEEASDMVRYQQIYQASARVFNTATVVIETILSIR